MFLLRKLFTRNNFASLYAFRIELHSWKKIKKQPTNNYFFKKIVVQVVTWDTELENDMLGMKE